MSLRRPLFLACGLACLALAIVGLFLPLLPTTPFLLLAAACFSRSSRRLHDWLLRQPTFGPILRDWEQHRAIRLRVKWTATVLLLLLIAYPLLVLDLPPAPKVLAGACAAGVLWFLWSRPSLR